VTVQKLRELTRQIEAETLHPAERTAYIALAEQREETDAERPHAVLKLAQ
jgi:hypothetical protein